MFSAPLLLFHKTPLSLSVPPARAAAALLSLCAVFLRALSVHKSPEHVPVLLQADLLLWKAFSRLSPAVIEEGG